MWTGRWAVSSAERTNALGQPVGAPVEGSFPLPRPPRAAMAGRHVTVAPLDVAAHGPALWQTFAAAADPRDWTYLPYGPFDGEQGFLSWLGTCTGDDPLFHTLIDAEGPAGLASYLRIDPKAGSIEVGHIHMGPRLQRSPASTEAMALMMGRAFDLGYRRYEWKCDALNARSCRAAERLGFTYEGIFRQATHYKGRNRDTAWFAAIDAEWPALKARFDRWLDPANFDAEGRQRAALGAA